MKLWAGIVLAAVGALIALSALAMDTSVPGTCGPYSQGCMERVHNLSLAQQQTTRLIFGCMMFLSGVLLIALSPRPQRRAGDRDGAASVASGTSAGMWNSSGFGAENPKYTWSYARELWKKARLAKKAIFIIGSLILLINISADPFSVGPITVFLICVLLIFLFLLFLYRGSMRVYRVIQNKR